MQIQCYSCCVPIYAPKQCGKCHKRVYCSKECQLVDWKGGHKIWCCKAGKLNHDFEIRDTEAGKGMGVFAKRDFVAGDKILVDRCLMFKRDDRFSKEKLMKCMSASQFAAVMNYTPTGEVLSEAMRDNNCDEPMVIKMSRNGFGGEEIDGVKMFWACIIGARFNHSCPPSNNCTYTFDCATKLQTFTALIPIKTGEEIFVNYLNGESDITGLLGALKIKYGFDCTCRICQNRELGLMYKRKGELEQAVFSKENKWAPKDQFLVLYEAYRLCEVLQVPELSRHDLYHSIGCTAIVTHEPGVRELLCATSVRLLVISRLFDLPSVERMVPMVKELQGTQSTESVLAKDVLSLFPAYCRTMSEGERERRLEELVPTQDLAKLRLERHDPYALALYCD